MLLRNVAVCSQEYPECRGHAADDHISKHCYTVHITTEEQGDRLQALIFEIDRLYQIDTKERCRQWFAAHPGEKECCFEGEEFVGARWVEADNKARKCEFVESTPANDVIAVLEELLAWFHSDEEPATEE